MSKLTTVLVVLSLLFGSALAQAWEPDNNNKLELSVAQALLKAREKDPAIEQWFADAYAYAIFPKVGRAKSGCRARSSWMAIGDAPKKPGALSVEVGFTRATSENWMRRVDFAFSSGART